MADDDILFRLVVDVAGTDAVDRLAKAIESGDPSPGEMRIAMTESVSPDGSTVRIGLRYELAEDNR